MKKSSFPNTSALALFNAEDFKFVDMYGVCPNNVPIPVVELFFLIDHNVNGALWGFRMPKCRVIDWHR